MQLLLDTHAFLWWLAGDSHLSNKAKRAIADETNEIYVSSASAWEIATKFRLGRLQTAQPVVANIAMAVASQSFLELPVTIRHGQLAGTLPPPHKDLFDRMLIAQSTLERMPLISNEQFFDNYGVLRIW